MGFCIDFGSRPFCGFLNTGFDCDMKSSILDTDSIFSLKFNVNLVCYLYVFFGYPGGDS